jgi:hypothetical protein
MYDMRPNPLPRSRNKVKRKEKGKENSAYSHFPYQSPIMANEQKKSKQNIENQGYNTLTSHWFHHHLI